MLPALKIITTTTLFSFAVSFGYSQIDSYDLNRYVQGDVNLSISSINPWIQFRTYSLDQDTRNYKYDYGSVRLYHNYLKYINAENKYVEYSLGNTLNVSADKTDEEKSLQIAPIIDLDYRANFYFSGIQFIGLDVDTRNSISYEKNYGSINSDPHSHKDFSTDSVIELSYGMGRAQNIEDPLKAIAIFRVLKQNKYLLADTITAEDIDELGNLLNKLRSLRNEDVNLVDSRLLTNARFELLSKHLIDNKLVRADNYAMFGLLYDTYRFENYYLRKANNEFRIGISYAYDRRYTHRESYYYISDRIYNSPSLFMSYDVNKALNTMWFLYSETNLMFNTIDFQRTDINDNNTTIYNAKTDRVSLSSEWYIQYQPSIRTRFNAGIEMYWSKSKIQEDSDLAIYEVDKEIEVFGRLDYYFSPRYLMTMDMGVRKEDLTGTDSFTKEISTSFDLTVTYIFR